MVAASTSYEADAAWYQQPQHRDTNPAAPPAPPRAARLAEALHQAPVVLDGDHGVCSSIAV
jgi:hypothetical protein